MCTTTTTTTTRHTFPCTREVDIEAAVNRIKDALNCQGLRVINVKHPFGSALTEMLVMDGDKVIRITIATP